MRHQSIIVLSIIILLIFTGCTPSAAPATSQPEVAQGTAPSGAAGEEPSSAVTEESPASASQEPSPAPGPEELALSAFSAPVTAKGDILILYGQVLDTSGSPLEGVSVEIWQTDSAGIYDHPGDADTANRDPGFQFYGTSITDASGDYFFRTVFPGQYEPRPRHIHVKVKQNGVQLLTTQFYFASDGASGGVGGPTENLLLNTTPATTADGLSAQIARFDIVVNTGTGGTMHLTDSQGEGPYYPVVDVSAFDNDLNSVEK
jgi:protocatechuate 3,4-dioxygenase beta subunit